jgi:hypothetical protein
MSTLFPPGTFGPDARANSVPRMLAAQYGLELKLLLRNGEQLLFQPGNTIPNTKWRSHLIFSPFTLYAFYCIREFEPYKLRRRNQTIRGRRNFQEQIVLNCVTESGRLREPIRQFHNSVVSQME